MTRIALPLAAGLAQAQAELIAAGGGAVEWELPDGEHALIGPLVLGVAGATVRLRGSDQVRLALTGGGLRLIGAAVAIAEVAIAATGVDVALAVEAASVDLADVEVVAAGPGDVTGVRVDAGATGRVAIDDLELAEVTAGGRAIAADVRGGAVRIARGVVGAIRGADVTAVRIAAEGALIASELDVGGIEATGAAAGVALAAHGGLDVASARVRGVRGDSVVGIRALASGEASLVDLTVTGLDGGAVATAIEAVGAGTLVARGISIDGVIADQAIGLLVAAGGGTSAPADAEPPRPALEVAFATVAAITGATAAVGARVLAGASHREVVVRDVAVTAVRATAPLGAPALAAAPDPAWTSWATAAIAGRAVAAAAGFDVPARPGDAGAVGLDVRAPIDEVVMFVDQRSTGDLIVADGSVRHVQGEAVVIEAGLRAATLRRFEVATAVSAGWAQADQLLIVNTTWHRLGAGLAIGAGELRVYDTIFSDVALSGDPIALDPDAAWMDGGAVFAPRESLRFAALGAAPYRRPGGPGLPTPWPAAAEDLDLRLADGALLHGLAVAPPPDELETTDPGAPYVGAYPPGATARCRFDDPLRPGTRVAPVAPAPPVVDYRARDAEALLQVMLDRAAVVMPPWTERGAADMTTMVLETVAERLDHLAYQQERAVAEGFLEDARLYRSIEDHVRPLDYPIDPGLSATTILRVTVDRVAAAGAGDDPVFEHLAADDEVDVPAGTLVANQSTGDRQVVFATEAPLRYVAALDRVPLVGAVAAGATRAEVHSIDPALAVGRWLILCERVDERGAVAGHVVRVTTVRRGTDVTELGWDPRRPMPRRLAAGIVLGNVVPAHHGLPLATLVGADPDAEASRQIAGALRQRVVGADEVVLPFHPISVWAAGYPRPDHGERRGVPQLAVAIDDEPWRRVDDLATAEIGERVYALRTSADGRAALRFGRDEGAALPTDEEVRLDVAPVVGLGAIGNVAEGVLTRLLHVPRDTADALALGRAFATDPEAVRRVLRVDNPVPAVGGREPEAADRIRYRAPRALARPLSAVRPEDYARVAGELPEVAAATARALAGPLRPIVRVTVLLADDDQLDDDERLRRWTVVRRALEDARLLGFDVETVPPRWVPLDLDVAVDAAPHAEAGALRDAVIASIAGAGGLLDPDTGKLGGDVHLDELYRAAVGVPGVVAARVRRFRRLDRADQFTSGIIAMAADEVPVVRGPSRPGARGVLTVTVCGGLT